MANNGTTTERNSFGMIEETVTKVKTTTENIAAFLQGRINVVTAKSRAEGKYLGDDVQISLASIPFGNVRNKGSVRFTPFLAILPKEVLIQQPNQNRGNTVASLFTGAHSNRPVCQINPTIWAALMPYIYGKDERKCFLNSLDYRERIGISGKEAERISSLCSPRLQRVGRGRDNEYVVILLDPLKIMRDLPIIKDAPGFGRAGYLVNIVGVTHLKDANYEYCVEKVPPKKAFGSSIHSIEMQIVNAVGGLRTR